MTLNLLHSINLDNRGGAEVQCLEFLDIANRRLNTHSDLILQGSFIFEGGSEKNGLEGTHIYREAYCGGVWIPPRPNWLRSLNRKRIAIKSDYSFLIVWSGLDGNGYRVFRDFKREKCVNWERGGAWYPDSDKKKKYYVDSISRSICNSYASLRMLELRWNFKGISKVVHNGLRPSALPLRAVEARDIQAKRVVTLGIAARLTRIKGIPSALYALQKLIRRGYEVRLSVAGDGQDWNILNELANKLDIENQVNFLGKLNNLNSFYDSIDILLVPSIRESFGQVVLEAGARGIPSIVSEVDGLPETIIRDKTGIVVPATLPESVYRKEYCPTVGPLPDVVYDPIKDDLRLPRAVDPEDLAGAISRLVSIPGLYVSMSAAVIQHVQENFNFESKVEKVENLLLSWENGS